MASLGGRRIGVNHGMLELTAPRVRKSSAAPTTNGGTISSPARSGISASEKKTCPL
jgi:hypothetical protein